MGDDVADAATQDARSCWWSRAWAWCARNRTPLAVLGAVAVIALAVAGWVLVPDLYAGVHDEPARVQAIVTTRASVLAALAGIGALISIGINLRNSNTQLRNAESAMRNTEIANQTLATTQETFRVTERGHQTGRYTAAIEQLGNEGSEAIRLGGIYALEQLAVDSGRDGDRTAVVEVLSAFIRLNRPVHPYGGSEEGRTTPRLERPAIDVQAATTVLGRLPAHVGAHRADLTDVDLSNLDLHSAQLACARLYNTDLTDVDLRNANLRGADLRGADLTDADLTGADLTGADLSDAHFALTTLTGADLTDADLTEVDLTGADLTGVVGLSEEQLATAWRRPDGAGACPRVMAVCDSHPRPGADSDRCNDIGGKHGLPANNPPFPAPHQQVETKRAQAPAVSRRRRARCFVAQVVHAVRARASWRHSSEQRARREAAEHSKRGAVAFGSNTLLPGSDTERGTSGGTR